MIQIYQDTGSSGTCVTQMIHSLKQFSAKLNVDLINGADIRQKHKLSPSSLLCFPGGYDLGFLRSLQPQGCDIVRHHIETGGRYLGLCAGAYFASDYCAFDVGGPLEVIGPRLIRLFPGWAVGPVYPGFQYDSEAGARAVRIEACLPDLDPLETVVYYNGGCTFELDDWKDCRVLYKYSDNGNPAIIACRLGLGWGILSGVHFEYDPVYFSLHSPTKCSDAMMEELTQHDSSRQALFHHLIDCLLDPLFDLKQLGFSTR